MIPQVVSGVAGATSGLIRSPYMAEPEVVSAGTCDHVTVALGPVPSAPIDTPSAPTPLSGQRVALAIVGVVAGMGGVVAGAGTAHAAVPAPPSTSISQMVATATEEPDEGVNFDIGSRHAFKLHHTHNLYGGISMTREERLTAVQANLINIYATVNEQGSLAAEDVTMVESKDHKGVTYQAAFTVRGKPLVTCTADDARANKMTVGDLAARWHGILQDVVPKSAPEFMGSSPTMFKAHHSERYVDQTYLEPGGHDGF